MNLTIVPIDRLVIVDGYSIQLELLSSPKNVHALQWDGEKGHIEFVNAAQPNKEIDALPKWAEDLVKKHNEALPVIAPFEDFDPSYIYKQYPVANLASIKEILETQYKNLQTAPRYRAIDGNIIGIDIVSLKGGANETGTVALLSLKSLVAKAKSLGVPIISDSTPEMVTREDYGSFLKNLGFDVIDKNQILYVNIPWTVDMAKAKKKADLNGVRENELSQIFHYAGANWQADKESRQSLMEVVTAINAGAKLPKDFTWRTVDNMNVTMTAESLKELFSAMTLAKREAYKNTWAKKSKVDAAKTFEEIEGV